MVKDKGLNCKLVVAKKVGVCVMGCVRAGGRDGGRARLATAFVTAT
jgi:hypothetical protein